MRLRYPRPAPHRAPSPLCKPGVTGGTGPPAPVHPRVRLCVGWATPHHPLPSAPEHPSQAGTHEGQARPASACAPARLHSACARGMRARVWRGEW